MTKKQRSALRRFNRIQDFLKTNPVEGTKVKLQVLDQVVRDMAAHGEAQDASSRVTVGETARQRALRAALRDQHMVPLARIARRVLGVPGMDQKFRLPPKKADNESILTAARGMTQAAEAHVAVFVQQAGLPADFIVKLRAAIDELALVIPTRVDGVRRRKTSRETIAKLVQRGVAAVDVLDAIVAPRLNAQPEVLAVWKSVKRPTEPGGGAATVELDITPVVKVA